LQNAFRLGMMRMEKVAKERMASLDPTALTPQAVISVKPVSAAVKTFFGSSQLSQFMDQINPLAELTHQRRLSARHATNQIGGVVVAGAAFSGGEIVLEICVTARNPIDGCPRTRSERSAPKTRMQKDTGGIDNAAQAFRSRICQPFENCATQRIIRWNRACKTRPRLIQDVRDGCFDLTPSECRFKYGDGGIVEKTMDGRQRPPRLRHMGLVYVLAEH